MARLSVIVLTLNEERNIGDCLESVRWADEIILADSGSTDRTVEIARGYTERILTIAWTGYGAARNTAIAASTGDWILWLDADERVGPELAAEVRSIVNDAACPYDGFLVARRAYFLGKWIKHSGWYPSRVLRLFRRGKGIFTETRVHERLELAGPAGRTQHDILHFTDPDLQHYLTKFNRYTTLAAGDLEAAGRRPAVADLLVRPPFLFFKMYVLRRGFLDGLHGLVLAVLSSAYVFVKYAKLWERSLGERH
jgi:glycosyltransferase involved in cell wall biosynthesis